MKQVARALVAQRKALVASGAFDALGKIPTFGEDVDLNAHGRNYPSVSLAVAGAPSSVSAVVPMKVTETVVVEAEEGDSVLLGKLVDVLIDGVNERPFFGFDATIHRATFGGVRLLPGIANERKAAISWDLLASWRSR